MPSRSEITTVLLSVTLGALISMPGCSTKEERWQQFDMHRRQEIGVMTKDYYLTEWGKPAKRAKSDDGGEVWTWEFSGYGGGSGLEKDAVLRTGWILERLSSRLLAQGIMVTADPV
jgi:hypothetical protein